MNFLWHDSLVKLSLTEKSKHSTLLSLSMNHVLVSLPWSFLYFQCTFTAGHTTVRWPWALSATCRKTCKLQKTSISPHKTNRDEKMFPNTEEHVTLLFPTETGMSGICAYFQWTCQIKNVFWVCVLLPVCMCFLQGHRTSNLQYCAKILCTITKAMPWIVSIYRWKFARSCMSPSLCFSCCASFQPFTVQAETTNKKVWHNFTDVELDGKKREESLFSFAQSFSDIWKTECINLQCKLGQQ